MKTKWVFGYHGAKETYWLEAVSLRNLLLQLSKRGMSKPDWYENTSHSA